MKIFYFILSKSQDYYLTALRVVFATGLRNYSSSMASDCGFGMLSIHIFNYCFHHVSFFLYETARLVFAT